MEIDRERSGIEKRLYELCLPVVVSCGYELYDFIYNPGSTLLQLFILDPKTKTAIIEDCIKVDHELSPLFESETWIPDSITLEVSSPGVYRVLKTPKHFEAALNKSIALVLNIKLSKETLPELPKRLNGQSKIKGNLTGLSPEGILLEIDKFKLTVLYTEIKKANIEENQ